MLPVPKDKDWLLHKIKVFLETNQEAKALAFIGEVIDNYEHHYTQFKAELSIGVELQRESNHPAPCQKFCERNAFNYEIRNLKRQVAEQQLEIKASKVIV